MRKLVFEEAGRLYGKHLEAEAIARDRFKEYEAVAKRLRKNGESPAEMSAAIDRYLEAVTLRGEITDELRLYERLASGALGGGEYRYGGEGPHAYPPEPGGWKPYWEGEGGPRFEGNLLSPVYINDLSP